MSLEAAGLYLDYSKNLLDGTILGQLLALADAMELRAAISAMFTGAHVNAVEDRPALHTALRLRKQGTAVVDGEPVAGVIENVLQHMARTVAAVREGRWRGFTGERITDVVNIGIGGSYLGPMLACDALRYETGDAINVHFLANVDGGEFDKVVGRLDPASTLFVVASKSFTTAETRLNAESARAWLANSFPEPQAIARHFIAVSAHPARAVEFGIAADNVYPMWDWVGGRYSVWSAIGLPVALAVGMAKFERMLAGAAAMDLHFKSAPLGTNMPVLLGLIAVWNNNFLGAETIAIVPYDDRLQHLPAYLQQLEMESNGKRVSLSHADLEQQSSPVIWGGLGTNAQHAFFQLLHQGTRLIPVDFVVALRHPGTLAQHHDVLVANCIAQAEGLMRGRRAATLGVDGADEVLARHRATPGNRPSNMLVLDALTPETLGALVALYEHKTYVQGVLWNVNSFDQWGVELGKVLADEVLADFEAGTAGDHDPSTQAIIERFVNTKKK